MRTAYQYPKGTVRWRIFGGDYDIRGYPAPKGWSASAHMLDYHPLTNRPLNELTWWIKEVKD